MAASQPARRLAAQNPLGQFFSDAGNRVDQFRRQAEAVGRAIYDASIKTGKPIVASTTADLVELGAKAIRNQIGSGKAIATVVRNPTSPQAKRILHEAGAQATAVVHGAADAITMGAADHVSAGIRAAIDSGGHLHQLRGLYDRNIAQERQQDQYEGDHYGKARMVGQIGGTAASMLVPVGELAQVARLTRAAQTLAAAKLAPRATAVARPVLTQIAERYLGEVPRLVKVGGGRYTKAAAMKLREYAALAGAGAASNMTGQAVGDVASGHRSTLGDYLVAGGVGAGQGALGHRYSPAALGAAGGAATSIGQDLIDRRPVSVANAALSASAGGLAGRAGGWVGEGGSDGLSIKTKGDLGEVLMRVRTRVRGESAPQLGPFYLKPHGRDRRRTPHTDPDEYIRGGLAEAKFGELPKLSVRQRQARKLIGADNYRIDNFLPRDIGILLGLPAAQAFAAGRRGAVDEEDARIPGLMF